MDDSRLAHSIFGGDDEHEEHDDPTSGRREGEVPAQHQGRLPRDRSTQSGRRRAAAREALTDEERREARTERKPAMSRGKAGTSCLALLVVMVLALGAAGYALYKVVGKLPSFSSGKTQEMPDYTGTGTGSVDITINPGDSGSTIGRTLAAAGVVKSASTFAAIAGMSPQFTKIQAGTYRMHRQMSSAAALDLLLDPSSHIKGGVVIREGLRADEVFAALSKGTGVPLADYKKVNPNTLGLPAQADGNVEGYLFPATYTFPKSMSAQQQLKTMVQQGTQSRASLNIPPDRLHDIMTIASIVQAEAGSADMAKVARVIDNRLKPGNTETYGKLQMDSTIHFIEKKRGSSKVSIEETKVNSPYNTYLHTGLPPGPIDSPGLVAIEAALHPATGNWYYFVTVNMDTGETLFAQTLAEQQANEAKYRAWCDAHQGRC